MDKVIRFVPVTVSDPPRTIREALARLPDGHKISERRDELTINGQLCQLTCCFSVAVGGQTKCLIVEYYPPDGSAAVCGYIAFVPTDRYHTWKLFPEGIEPFEVHPNLDRHRSMVSAHLFALIVAGQNGSRVESALLLADFPVRTEAAQQPPRRRLARRSR